MTLAEFLGKRGPQDALASVLSACVLADDGALIYTVDEWKAYQLPGEALELYSTIERISGFRKSEAVTKTN